ncbi:butyrophilin subfamily 2 member A2-like [Labrus bergylta]|uniref:butyrophilin subfamily 2 member A2-like n=1 Tax=Labrus bergylta TaxID=56723 RepID=UPI003313905D
MCRMEERFSFKRRLGSFSAFLHHSVVILLLRQCCCAGHSQVVAPSLPIVAMVGDDIILPCRLDPPVDTSDMTVEWVKDVTVHTQPEKWRRVTEALWRSELRMNLQCESEGWYPELEVLWLDSEGNLLSAGSTESVRGPDGLYTVSSRVTVERRHNNMFTCRVTQNNINQTRETHIHVPDDMFMVGCRSGPHITIFSAVGLSFIVALFLVVLKCRQNKISMSRFQCSFISMHLLPLHCLRSVFLIMEECAITTSVEI